MSGADALHAVKVGVQRICLDQDCRTGKFVDCFHVSNFPIVRRASTTRAWPVIERAQDSLYGRINIFFDENQASRGNCPSVSPPSTMSTWPVM